MDLDTTLARLAVDLSASVDLAEVALHLAVDEYPDLDVSVYLARLDTFADMVARSLRGSLVERVGVLSEFLFAEEGFAGNSTAYYDPRNSYFNDVLDRRLGLPITLSVLAIAVGERAGMAVYGVGLPGHFVAKAVAGDTEVLFDPFHGGRVLDRNGCEELVAAVTGQPFAATTTSLAETPPGHIIVRMLNNLKTVYLKDADFDRVARVTRRLVQLLPHDPTQRRDLGVCLLHAGHPGQAIDPLRAYLDSAPAAPDAATVADYLVQARRLVARWN